MKKLKLLLSFLLVLVLTFCGVACTDIPDDTDGPKDFGDWTNWGLDDWATGKYEEFDPSKNYNLTDWSKDYPGYDSEITYDVSKLMRFFSSKHVQVFQAEKAVLGGNAKVEEDSRVGYLTDGSITYTITAEEECDALLIGSFATYDSKYGYLFESVFTLTVNGKSIDTDDSWIKPTEGWTDFAETAIGEVHLNKGDNVLSFYSPVAKANVDYIKLVPRGELSSEELNMKVVYDYKQGLLIQAENTDYANCGTQSGATGQVVCRTSYKSKITFSLNSDVARTTKMFMSAAMRIGKSSGIEESTLKSKRIGLSVNGTPVGFGDETVAGREDSKWYNYYSDYEIAEISLSAGENVVEITFSPNCNVDYFYFDKMIYNYPSYDYSEGLKIEAEETFYKGAVKQTNLSTQKGEVLSSLSDATEIKFIVKSDVEKEVEFFVNAVIRVDDEYSGNVSERFTLKVNGEPVDLFGLTMTGVTFDSTGWWLKEYSGVSLGKINLSKGENLIELTPSSEMNIDYFYFDKMTVVYPTYDYSAGVKIEAEDTLFSSATVQTLNGIKILGILSKNTKIKFIVKSDEAREIEFFVHAVIRVDAEYSGNVSERFTLKINGDPVNLSAVTLNGVTHSDSDAWYYKEYSDSSLGKINLSKGENLIEITTSEEMNLDYFYLDKMPAPEFEYAEGLKVEAENTLFAGATVQDAASGKILGILDEETRIEFVINADSDKETELFVNALIRVDTEYSGVAKDRFTLTVNGTPIDLSSKTLNGVTHSDGDVWYVKDYSVSSLGRINLAKGKNVIVITTSEEMNVDYFTFG